MAAEPAHGPGRDEDPARRAPEPGEGEPLAPGPADEAQAPVSARADDSPLPVAPSALAEEAEFPAASPDWLDDEEWAAIVAAREDEEESVDPYLEDPPDWEELDAAVAEAREITAAEARDSAYAARMVFYGGWGAVGAAPGRRGPGQPGSAASFPGEHASPAAAFGSGFALDTAPGCAVLAGLADAAAGPGDRYPGATDDEIVGVICAWARVEAHAAARKLAAIAELIRRRPAEDCASQNPAPDPGKDAKTEDSAPLVPAKDAVAEGFAPPDSAKDAAADGAASPQRAAAQMPEAWDEFAVDELSCALGESRAAAEELLDLAHSLAARLPGTMAALRDGILSQAKADIIARATSVLDADEAAAAENMVLDRAGADPARAAGRDRPRCHGGRPGQGEEAPRGGGEENPGGTVDGGLRERRPGRPGTAHGAGPGRGSAHHRVGEGTAGGGPGR